MKLHLSLACGEYPTTRALADGSVSPEGIELTFVSLDPGEIFWRMLRHAEFDVSEMSLSNLIMAVSRGDDRFVGLPVFTSRAFRHSSIWVREGITEPHQLRGKRVGIPEYTTISAARLG